MKQLVKEFEAASGFMIAKYMNDFLDEHKELSITHIAMSQYNSGWITAIIVFNDGRQYEKT